MSLLSKITELVTGGIGEKLIDTVKDYFPPSMTDAQKSEVERAIRQAARDHELNLISLAQQEQAMFDERIKELEGTSADLKTIPIIGPALIFARGAQRPVWGFATLYMDFLYFFEGITFTEKQESAMWVINLLVLGFLFGERAVKNMMPLVTQAMQARAKG